MKRLVVISLLSAVLFSGCDLLRKDNPYPEPTHFDHVSILFSEGFNNLSSSLAVNVDSLCNGNIPFKWEKNVILVFSHQPRRYGAYSLPTSPALYRVYRTKTGKVVRDTLKVYPEGTVSVSKETLGEVLEFAERTFPSDRMGMIYSSHGTGWIYDNEPGKSGALKSSRPGRPQIGFLTQEDEPLTKSIGHQSCADGKDYYSINIEDFADAIPGKLDYIILDACLMGGVETAWALRNKCRYLAISPTEILSKGYYVYQSFPDFLFGSKEPDLKGLCKAFFEFYRDRYSGSRSATVTLLDCSGLQNILEPAKAIIESHRDEIFGIDENDIQKFYWDSDYYSRCFCDMIDILEHTSAGKREIFQLRDALDKCIVYKDHTDTFMGSKIDSYCGLSMFLPGPTRSFWDGTISRESREDAAEREAMYRTTSWNSACGLVK